MRRGFLLTLDALAALGLCFWALGLLLPFSGGVYQQGYSRARLQRYSSDLLATMEKQGDISRAASSNRSAVARVFALTGQGRCFSLKLYSMPSGNLSFAHSKAGCGYPSNFSVSAVAPTWINGSRYIAVMEGWSQ
jgi:hypothetical protein